MLPQSVTPSLRSALAPGLLAGLVPDGLGQSGHLVIPRRQAGGAAQLYSHRLPEGLRRRAEASGVAVTPLDSAADIGWQRDAEFVAIDGWGFDEAYLSGLASGTAPLLVVDYVVCNLLSVEVVGDRAGDFLQAISVVTWFDFALIAAALVLARRERRSEGAVNGI